MKTSLKAQEIMKKMESLSLYPYDDQKVGNKRIYEWVKGATIGYGHLIKTTEWNMYKNGINVKDADNIFSNDLIPFENCVNSFVRKSLKQNEFDALVMLAFNIGIGAFQTSSVLKMINGGPGNYSSLESAWGAFNKSQGKIMNGLTKRRKLEYDLYTNGIYKFFQ